MRYELTKWPTDKSKRAGMDLGSLEREIASLGANEQFQLWMYREDGEMACVLANAERAYLGILPAEKDHAISLDPEFKGPEDSVEKIYLENGQLDEMPRVHCVARESGISAGLHYFRTGMRAPFLTWA